MTGLGAQRYNDPQLAVDSGAGDVFTLRGRDLLRISLDEPLPHGPMHPLKPMSVRLRTVQERRLIRRGHV